MIATRAAVISIAFAVSALLPTGCNSGPSNNDRRAIHAWLTCDDCASGQRGAVAVLGDNAVPELAGALEGPTSDQRAIMTAKFESSFSRIASRVSPMQKGAYTTFRNDNYIANYQKRAAISLGDIGTDAARKALDGALADSATRKYRSDVMRVIKFARSRVDGTTYPGKIVPFRLGFADPVKVVADSGHQFGQQATVTIEDSLFPASQLPIHRFPDSITFLSLAATGLHMIAVRESPTAAPTKIAMFIASSTDRVDRRPPVCPDPNDVQCLIDHADTIPVVPLTDPNGLTFFSVTRGTPAESMQFYKVQNPSLASPRAVTAHVVLRGDGDQHADVQWLMCGTGSPYGQATHGATGQTLQVSASVPAGGCLALKTSFVSGAATIYVQLQMTSP
jgi:hypothetical protein